MNNIQEKIYNYLRSNDSSNNIYGNLMENSDRNLKSFLTRDEIELYEEIKQSDKNRLLKYS